MIKKLLIVALAVLTAGSAYALKNPNRTLKPTTTKLTAFDGKIERPKKAQTRADDSELNFTLAGEWGNVLTLGLPVGVTVYLAFEFSEENAKIFAGNEVTAVNITSGICPVGNKYLNYVRNVNVFLTEDLEEEPFYTQSGRLGSEGVTEYSVPLTTPYKIEAGKSFYVGYSFDIPREDQFYIPVDLEAPETIDGCWIGALTDNGIVWDNAAEGYGSICMGCTIKGDNLPHNNVALLDWNGPSYVEPGTPFEYDIYLKNKGLPITSLEIEYSVNGEAPQTGIFELNSPLPYGGSGLLPVKDLICDVESLTIPVEIKISKVDGVANMAASNSMETIVYCFEPSKGFYKTLLLEEATGTWCGWCPMGIEMMEYVSKTYPQKFALVAIHDHDEMAVPSTQPVIDAYVPGYPFAMVDRSFAINQWTNKEIDGIVAEYEDIPAAMSFTYLSAQDLGNGKVKVDSKIKFGLGSENNDRFRMIYYITENNVGPYVQNNYFSGGDAGPLNGWESKPEEVSTMYNDVCRYMEGDLFGLSNSVPATIVAGDEYSYSVEMPTNAVASKDYIVTAFVLDTDTGQVVNAQQVKSNEVFASVSDIYNDATPVSKKYYNISGFEVKDPRNGIYVVRTTYSDGTVKTTKEAFK